MRAVPIVLLLALLLARPLLSGEGAQKPETLNAKLAQKVPKEHLENAYRLSERVYTGAQPGGEQSFKDLADLGVKTVISVDGSKPDVATAKKFGLRYVHLPIGYDGVSDERARELAKVIVELPGPVYVHCHHGKHRGPAAAAAACIVAGDLTNAEALAGMKVLGTGENYLGLWDSVRQARQAAPETLKRFQVDFKETAPIPPLAQAMVRVDEGLDRLKDCKAAGWKTPQDHPDLDPPHEALKLRELFTEIMRTEDFTKRPDDFKGWMKKAEQSGQDLESELQAWAKAKYEGAPPAKADPLLKELQNNCTACHSTYRNPPKK